MGFKKLLFTFSLLLTVFVTHAQVITSSISGVVTDSKGEGLIGATVKATHTPTGTIYGTTTRNGGEFTIPNMRVGGPYKVEVSFISFGTETYNDIFLKLGEPLKMNVKLSEGSTNLKEISITATKNITKGNGGTALNISRSQMDNIPTVNRSVQDFARLSPQASVSTNGKDGSPAGISFGGMSNKYNQFAVDGAVTNDVFGLSSSGTNGGQAGANPISMETIDQLQIVLNPYDVKQSGFTGGGINAITKSGTNEFHGAAYVFYQDQSFVGKAPDSTHSKYGSFSNKIFGASLGGAIIKNKLFFYVNAERSKRNNPIDYNPANGANKVSLAELQSISDYLTKAFPTYNPGSFTDQERDKPSTTLFARIDWNINSVHKLTIRNNYLDASDMIASRAPSIATFGNVNYTFPSKSNSSVLELNSNFSNKLSNEFRVGYNVVKDRRKYLGDPFPSITINDNGNSIYLGTEPSSGANALDQNIWTFTDNLTMYHGKHTITVGANAEFYKIKNTFIQNAFGAYTFNSISSFIAGGRPTAYSINYTTADSLNRDGIGFKAAQVGIYAQDEWNIRRNFTLTYGVRVDMPFFPTTPPNNTNFEKDPNFAGYSTATIPKQRPLIAPRVGFSWDVTNDGKTTIRGGVGIFTGRVPFVWISNQYNNTGNIYTNINLSSAPGNTPVPAGLVLRYDPKDPFYGQYSAAGVIAAGANFNPAASNINLTDKNFKFPQVFKTNLAVERQLPWGMRAMIEGNFAKTLNNAYWTNLNVVPTGDSISMGGAVKRPTWKRLSTDFGPQVLLMKNTSDGYTYNISGELTKVTNNGFFFKVGYSYGDSYSLNDGTSSTAASNWRFSPNINGLNNLEMARSNYSMGNRVLAVVSKAFKYGKDNKYSTTLTLFYNGQSGIPYSWVYFNSVDPTGDDLGSSGNNDLIYIPTASEIQNMSFKPITASSTSTYTRSEAEQRQDLERLISNDSYLSKHRGENAKKNASRTPFENIFDFKIAQVIPIIKSHKVEITFDILNVGNLLNRDWGRTYFISNNASTPLTYSSRNATTGVSTFQYDRRREINGFGDEKPYYINNFTARWRGQLGLRYSF